MQHVEKVFGVAEVVARVDDRLPLGGLVGDGRERGHLGDHAHARALTLLCVANVGRVVVKRGERTDHADHDGHRVRIVLEALVKLDQLLVHQRVALDLHLKAALLHARGQLAVHQEVAGVCPVSLFGELLDGVAAVEQRAPVAVDKGDGRLAGGRAGKAGVKRADARPVGTGAGDWLKHCVRWLELADIDKGVARSVLWAVAHAETFSNRQHTLSRGRLSVWPSGSVTTAALAAPLACMGRSRPSVIDGFLFTRTTSASLGRWVCSKVTAVGELGGGGCSVRLSPTMIDAMQ